MNEVLPDGLSDYRHALRTPVNHIVGYAELLVEEARDASDEVREKLLARVIDAGGMILTAIHETVGPASRPAKLPPDELAHRIAEPLATILSVCDGLEKTLDHGQSKDFLRDLERIRGACAKLDTLTKGSNPGPSKRKHAISAQHEDGER